MSESKESLKGGDFMRISAEREGGERCAFIRAGGDACDMQPDHVAHQPCDCGDHAEPQNYCHPFRPDNAFAVLEAENKELRGVLEEIAELNAAYDRWPLSEAVNIARAALARVRAVNPAEEEPYD